MLDKIINWCISSKIFCIPRKNIMKLLSQYHLIIYSYKDPYRAKVMDFIRKIKNENKLVMSFNEAYQLYNACEQTKKIEGDIAEVGVYRGGSARIICEIKGNRPLHLFDTFMGLPEVEEIDSSFKKGQYAEVYKNVKKYLEKYSNIHFYKGIFPLTSYPLKNKKFSFVNLDVDLYKSTLDCLNFFYPRMTRGGIIISHDYIYAAGVKKAVDEFFKDKPEPIVTPSSTQCLIVKV